MLVCLSCRKAAQFGFLYYYAYVLYVDNMRLDLGAPVQHGYLSSRHGQSRKIIRREE